MDQLFLLQLSKEQLQLILQQVDMQFIQQIHGYLMGIIGLNQQLCQMLYKCMLILKMVDMIFIKLQAVQV